MLAKEDFKSPYGKNMFEKTFWFLMEGEIPQITEAPTNSIEDLTQNPIETLNPFERISRVTSSKTTVDEPTLEDKLSPFIFTEYLRANNIIGEEANAFLINAAIIAGNNVLLRGYSGTGKSYVMQAILNLYGSRVARVGISSSESVWHRADELNEVDIIYIPELQKFMRSRNNIELVKSLGEGVDAIKKVTNNKRNGVDTYIVKSPKILLSTFAYENDFVVDIETLRRFTLLDTENTREHILECLQGKVNNGLNLDLSGNLELTASRLAKRISYAMDTDNIVLNPFLAYFVDRMPPSNKSQCYLNHYMALFNGSGKFFSPERTSFSSNGKNFTILDLQDIYNVVTMYNSQFVATMNHFSKDKESTLEFDWAACFNSGIRALQSDMTIRFPNNTIKLGKEFVSAIDNWYSAQIKDNSVLTTDYKSGSTIEIANLR